MIFQDIFIIPGRIHEKNWNPGKMISKVLSTSVIFFRFFRYLKTWKFDERKSFMTLGKHEKVRIDYKIRIERIFKNPSIQSCREW